MDAYKIVITPAAALFFGAATALGRKAMQMSTTPQQAKTLGRLENRSLDSAAKALGIHRDDIMAVYNLHRGLPIAVGKNIVRPA